MFRRLSSLGRVAVDRSLSLFHGYYPDAKTSRHPSRRASFSFAWRYHGCAGDSLPCEGRRAIAGPGCWLEAATRYAADLSVEMAGSPKFPQNPLSLCTCSYDPGRTGRDFAFTSRRHGPGYGNAQGFFEYPFEAQSHGLTTGCLRFAAAVFRPRRKTRLRLLARLCRAGFAPAEF